MGLGAACACGSQPKTGTHACHVSKNLGKILNKTATRAAAPWLVGVPVNQPHSTAYLVQIFTHKQVPLSTETMAPDPQQPQSQYAQNNEAQHPPEYRGTSRRATGKPHNPSSSRSYLDSLRRRQTNDSANRQPQKQDGNKDKPLQASYSSYNLAWEALRRFLETKWPGRVFVAQHVSPHPPDIVQAYVNFWKSADCCG